MKKFLNYKATSSTVSKIFDYNFFKENQSHPVKVDIIIRGTNPVDIGYTDSLVFGEGYPLVSGSAVKCDSFS